MPRPKQNRPTARKPALSPILRGKTTADEVVDRLIMAIAHGDKAAGERITEAQLARALDVSRVPAREAMQKLQVQGILVSGERRGLRVSDYGPERIAQLFELRRATEKIILQHIMRDTKKRISLVAELETVVADMRDLAGSGDAIALSLVDLDFHRVIARHSGNFLAAQIWEGLAQHLIIVFCRHWSDAADQIGEVRLHERLIEFIRSGAADDIDAVLESHHSEPPKASALESIP